MSPSPDRRTCATGPADTRLIVGAGEGGSGILHVEDWEIV